MSLLSLFSRNVSGGRAAVEVFQDIVSFALSREIEIDTAF
jgi:hypothetical protein